MTMNREITMDSFGAECPTNWQEIATYLNEYIADKLAALDENTPDYEVDALIDRIWESYCAGKLPDCPADAWDEMPTK